jgi:hypothetical protein
MRRITAIDCTSLFNAADAIASRLDQQRITFDYSFLYRRLAEILTQHGWPPAEMVLALVSVDPKSENQGRFTTALERIGYTIAPIDYHEAFVSVPPGRAPGDEGRSVITMAPRISFLAGLLSRYADAQLLVVSHAYENYWPLEELARRATKGHAGVAYFSSLIDFRFRATGILDPRPRGGGVSFFDLEDVLPTLIGVGGASQNERHTGGEVFAKIG